MDETQSFATRLRDLQSRMDRTGCDLRPEVSRFEQARDQLNHRVTEVDEMFREIGGTLRRLIPDWEQREAELRESRIRLEEELRQSRQQTEERTEERDHAHRELRVYERKLQEVLQDRQRRIHEAGELRKNGVHLEEERNLLASRLKCREEEHAAALAQKDRRIEELGAAVSALEGTLASVRGEFAREREQRIKFQKMARHFREETMVLQDHLRKREAELIAECEHLKSGKDAALSDLAQAGESIEQLQVDLDEARKQLQIIPELREKLERQRLRSLETEKWAGELETEVQRLREIEPLRALEESRLRERRILESHREWLLRVVRESGESEEGRQARELLGRLGEVADLVGAPVSARGLGSASRKDSPGPDLQGSSGSLRGPSASVQI